MFVVDITAEIRTRLPKLFIKEDSAKLLNDIEHNEFDRPITIMDRIIVDNKNDPYREDVVAAIELRRYFLDLRAGERLTNMDS